MKMPTDTDIAAALDRKRNSERIAVSWNWICASAVGLTAFSSVNAVMRALDAGPILLDDTMVASASIGAVWASALSLKSALSEILAPPRDVPQQFLDELREKASEISAHRNAKGLWIVCDPTEENLRIMTPAEFKQYEKLVAAQGRGLDKLQVSGNKLTYCRYVGGKLHAPENEPAMVTVDMKTRKGEAKFFTNGVKAFAENKDMKLPFGANRAEAWMKGVIDIKPETDLGSQKARPDELKSPIPLPAGTFDFENGKGPVPAHQHTNPDGGIGGWVADSATVASTAYVGKNARVFDNAVVGGKARIHDNARVSGKAQVFAFVVVSGNALVYDRATVCGNALVSDNAQIYDDAMVYDKAVISGDARVCGEPYLDWGEWTTGVIDTTPDAQSSALSRRRYTKPDAPPSDPRM